MPNRFEADAAQTAAATLPRATEVKAIEDCTVDGRQQRKTTPVASVVGRMVVGRRAASRPRTGNSAKVEARMTRCRRQLVIPAMTASRDSLAPCRKKSRAITSLVISDRSVAAAPRTGSTLASATMPRIAST